MMGYTHAAAGAAIGAAAGQIAGLPGLGAAIGALAAVLPDIDHPGSIVGRRIRPASVLLEVTAGHRTITHTVWFCIGVGVLAVFAGRFLSCLQFSFPAWLWFSTSFLGAISHLVLDGMTRSGIEPFWPLKAFSFRGPVRTGSFVELPIAGMFLFLLFEVLINS